ncbi:hypothetical protein GC173_12925 [bacterium]|nr:hypothetical protein [bacterium]
MNAEIRYLLEVQALDQEAIELNGQLARYPQIWDEVKQKLAQKKAAIEEAVKNKERHSKERRRVEQKIRLFADDHRKYAAQLSTIKTQREFEAINRQIEQVKAKLSALEEQGVELLRNDEAVDKGADVATEDFKKYEAYAKEEKERIRVQFNTKKQRLAEVEKAKSQIMAKVSPELIEVYERINRRHPGTAVVPVRSAHEDPNVAKKARNAGKDVVRPGACGGCHFGLLPDVLVQVRRESKIVECPNCGRILSEDENYTPTDHTGA